MLVCVALFPLFLVSYHYGDTQQISGFYFGPLIYGAVQLLRIALAVIFGLFLRTRVCTGTEDTAKAGYQWKLLLFLLIWAAYAANGELRWHLTDYQLQIGLVGGPFSFGELSVFRQWIYESFIAPWPWLAWLISYACATFSVKKSQCFGNAVN